MSHVGRWTDRFIQRVLTAWIVILAALAPQSALRAQSVCNVGHLTASNGGTFDRFGQDVAVSGDVALIGASWDLMMTGSAYVFRQDGTGWVQEQQLFASDGDFQDHFGFAVAIEGDTAMVGAVNHVVHAPHHGAVYVFRSNGVRWTEAQELIASTPTDGFGASVCMSGNVAIIGAPGDDENGLSAGAAYVFRFDPQSRQWVEEQKLLATPANSLFGRSVSISGETAVIGAPHYTSKCDVGSGAAFVFRYDPAIGGWLQEQQLITSDCDTGDLFGDAVSVLDDVVLVGADGHAHDRIEAGAAYIFRYDAQSSQWVEEQELLASDGFWSDNFGQYLALGAGVAVVGALGDDDAGSDDGAAYLFRFDGSGWLEQQKLLPDAGPWASFFGSAVALAGDKALIGAQGEDGGAGAVYAYAGLLDIDCNDNGRPDGCDIFLDRNKDADGDGVPDECCPWDLDGDGNVGITDLVVVLSAWGQSPGGPPDFDGDGTVGITDLVELLSNWGPCS